MTFRLVGLPARKLLTLAVAATVPLTFTGARAGQRVDGRDDLQALAGPAGHRGGRPTLRHQEQAQH